MRMRTASASPRFSASTPPRGNGPPRHPATFHPAAACIFCDPALPLASTGTDALGFIDHLAVSSECGREYELWRGVIRDEWEGD